MSDSQALRETLASYVPGLFIKRLASQGTPGEPVAEQFPAAVLLAGISGFTALAGRQNKARQAWQRSIAIAESLSMPYEQGLGHFEMGRHMRADTYEREKHLQHAEAIFTDLDASLDLARTQHAIKN